VKKIFVISEYLAKLQQARAWLSHALCAPGQHTLLKVHEAICRQTPWSIVSKPATDSAGVSSRPTAVSVDPDTRQSTDDAALSMTQHSSSVYRVK